MAKKNKKEKRQRKGKEVIDLTSYISPEMLQADVDGELHRRASGNLL